MTTLAKTLRLTLLLVLLGSTVMVLVVNGNIDPRVYRFLTSDHGRAVAGIMGWSVDFNFLPADKPESEMTRKEIQVKRNLESTVRDRLPRHRLVLRSGEVLSGRLVGRDENGGYSFMQSFGDSGSFCAHIPEYRVLRLEGTRSQVPDVTYRDVKFHLEFPDLSFYRRPPYTVVTDQNYLQVERAVKDLQRLHHDFVSTFGPLITLPDRGEAIQLLFFENEERYRAYQRNYAPQLEHTAGFYTPKLDRFVVFNQIHADQRQIDQELVFEKIKAARKNAGAMVNMGRVKDWQIRAGRSVIQHAEEQTRMTVRHEGAHQLFFTYGVHSSHHAENSWLIEGLASFHETTPPGSPQAGRIALLKEAEAEDSLIPLAELVNSRSPRGLYTFWGDKRVQLAYAQSWALVNFLMREQHRKAFFSYMDYVRDPAHIDDLAANPRVDLLARSLGMDTTELERQWQWYIRSI